MNTNNRKNGITVTIKQETTTRDGGQKTVSESLIYDKIPAYIININGSTFSRELGAMTDTGKIVIKVGKKTGIEKRMKAYIYDKGNLMGAYIIYEVEPKRDRGRLLGVYLYLDRGNDK